MKNEGQTINIFGKFTNTDAFGGEFKIILPDTMCRYFIDSMAAGDFGCWEPDYRGETGINQYDHYLATVRHAYGVEDINGDGRKDLLIPQGMGSWRPGAICPGEIRQAGSGCSNCQKHQVLQPLRSLAL